MMLIVNPDDAGEVERAQKCVRQMVYLALDLGGTCTGKTSLRSERHFVFCRSQDTFLLVGSWLKYGGTHVCFYRILHLT
jgi:hypothetical protein